MRLAPLLLLGGIALQPVALRAEPIRIVTTLQPLAWIAQEVGADRTRSHVLLPPGASPHAFEPRPSDLAQVAGADLWIEAGAGVDSWAAALARATPAHCVRLRLADLGGPPHAWLDPLFVRDRLVPAVAGALVQLDPAGEAAYQRRTRRFRERLQELDRWIHSLLARAPGRYYVAYHPAFRPFATRYDLHEVGVVQVSPGEEPTPRALARLAGAARAAGVRALLVEPQLDPRSAQRIAEVFGGRTVLVDPLGDPSDPERDSYLALLRFDARAFRAALGGPDR